MNVMGTAMMALALALFIMALLELFFYLDLHPTYVRRLSTHRAPLESDVSVNIKEIQELDNYILEWRKDGIFFRRRHGVISRLLFFGWLPPQRQEVRFGVGPISPYFAFLLILPWFGLAIRPLVAGLGAGMLVGVGLAGAWWMVSRAIARKEIQNFVVMLS